MTDVRVYLATLADVDVLMPLMVEYYAFDHLPFDEGRARGALVGLLQDLNAGRVWLVRVGRDAAGYVAMTLGYSLEYQGRDAFVDELYLRAPYRGQGIGRQLLDLVVDTCRALGVQALHLEVDRANRRARALYRAFGFEEHDRLLMTRVLGA